MEKIYFPCIFEADTTQQHPFDPGGKTSDGLNLCQHDLLTAAVRETPPLQLSEATQPQAAPARAAPTAL